MLNLRQAVHFQTDTHAWNISQLQAETYSQSNMIGNIGEPLEHSFAGDEFTSSDETLHEEAEQVTRQDPEIILGRHESTNGYYPDDIELTAIGESSLGSSSGLRSDDV
ncbi:hypothetical protein PHLCEN_2v6243 [Hermanssonia centrifuga]|uniref:Uncharacterized protein n=1 Tax=Hermanssonia centrifuga TaxID=98765 RepID=A0A2R6P012_9APHY|nr:hypothetical protein PHLCEN_2v6243 [Hermanssonia centrifuga]